MPDDLRDPEPTRAPRILFVEDDADVLKAAEVLLRRHGMVMDQARSPAEALSALASDPPEVTLLDLNFTRGATSGAEGLALLSEIRAQDPHAVVVVVTGHSGISVAVTAMQAGASDFVTKPWNNARLVATIETALAQRSRRLAGAGLRDGDRAPGLAGWDEDAQLLGVSAAIERTRDVIRHAAPTDAPVLIYGEAGTGKSLIARLLHRSSTRSGGAFVPLDIGALDEFGLEAALFGSAQNDRAGALADARGGTLFLDEVAALSPALQGRLLALLQSGRLALRDGGFASLDVRLICATRWSREALRGPGGLRDELLYRLNTVEMTAPSLRERGEDALLLAEHFLRLFARRHGKPMRLLSDAAAEAILHDPWPGDVRSLRQAMERCVIFADGPRYEPADIAFLDPEGAPSPPPSASLLDTEKALVAAALKRHSFNVSRAAGELGLTRAALYRRMAKHGL